MSTHSSASTKRELNEIQDATPSWSGYNYQGKIALYLVLSTCNQLRQVGSSTDEYTVEIEYLEDIAILQHGKYQSLHQVKSENNDRLSAYQDAIWILLGKMERHSPAKGVYLHTVRAIREHTKDDVKGLGASANVADIRERVLKKFGSLYQKFQIHRYPSTGNVYCALDEIDREIDAQLEKYLSVAGIMGQDIVKKRLKLLNIIHDHIFNRHLERQRIAQGTLDAKRQIPQLPFSHFEESLCLDHEEPDDFYLLCRLKEWFTSVCDEYVTQQLNNGQSDLNYLLDAARLVGSLTYEQFQHFCRKVNPHVPWTTLDLIKFKGLFEKDSTRASLLLAIRKITKTLHEVQFTYESNQRFYIPTTIRGGPQDEDYELDRKEKARSILHNRALDEIIMEANTFITSHMDMPSLQEVAMDTVEEADPDSNERNHITRLGRINMITLEQALGEIK
ncbi:MAG: hypothetical protein P0Y55_09960 [Candidatus Cohnella colombiensis]|uniref:ABC-three component systems C-terminal domain-containing protein n=1 Tax=Candidatus Cohnella colombiensis TaxID=3121368 RepID=A0AA95JBJ6_9BACL|nr:MAG: hypothetical protein P0Y55_09960 [Cohnella sp.]